MNKRVKGSSIGRALGAAALAAILSATPMPVVASSPAPSPAAQTLDPAVVKADFEELYRRLQRAHFDLYARRSKPEYDRLYRRMSAELVSPLPPLEVAKRFQRFTAFGKVAHARIDAAYAAFEAHLAGGGKAFPLALRIERGRVFVAENRSGLAEVRPGDEVLALDGRPIARWLALCAGNLSADTDYMAAALMELDFPMLLWLETGSRDGFRLTLRGADGQRRRPNLPARTRTEMARAARDQPPRLDLSKADRSWRMLDGGIGYLRPGPFYNTDPKAADMYDNEGFRRFIDQAFKGILAASAPVLIIDLRDNPGGDSSFSDLMVSWFADRPYRFNSAFLIKVSPEATASNAPRLAITPPGSPAHRFAALYGSARNGDIVRFDTPEALPRTDVRYRGRVYLLINRNSFSNTVAVAATVQDYRFGTILGEETSDLATTYGAMETFTLPGTGLKAGFPKARIVRPSGDAAARGVRPDHAIDTPVIEHSADPVLQRAIALVRKRTRRT